MSDDMYRTNAPPPADPPDPVPYREPVWRRLLFIAGILTGLAAQALGLGVLNAYVSQRCSPAVPTGTLLEMCALLSYALTALVVHDRDMRPGFMLNASWRIRTAMWSVSPVMFPLLVAYGMVVWTCRLTAAAASSLWKWILEGE